MAQGAGGLASATEGAFETASWGRRFLALLVDWVVCTLVASLVIGPGLFDNPGDPVAFTVHGIYVVETTLLTWLAGGSFGKLATGLRTVPADGHLRLLSPLRLLVRQVLVVLVIPPLVFRPNGRGLHDLAAATSTVTTPVFRQLAGRAA